MHSKKLSPHALIFLLVASIVQAEQTHLDTNFLGSKPTPTPVAAPAMKAPEKKNENKPKQLVEDQRSDAKAIKDSIETINSFTLLLSKVRPGTNRNNLLINRAAAYNIFARQKILASKNKMVTPNLKRYLNAAIRDAEEVLRSPAIRPEHKWKAHDIAGISYLYLDQDQLAISHFMELLKNNPPDAKAGRVGLLVAEDFFDQKKFTEATELYKFYLKKMTPQLQELAIYKLAWCMINLDQQNEAIKYFAKVSHSNSTSGIGKDATRDLAYFVTHGSDPATNIAKAEKEIPLEVDRIFFLYEVRSNFEAQGSIQQHTEIVNRLLKIEKDPEKRVELSLANLRVQRKFYASKTHVDAFFALAESLKKLPQNVFTPIFQKYSTEIENETQVVMKAFVDTFAGRIKTSENFTKTEIAETLKNLFEFYHSHFSGQKNYPSIISIWDDVCLEMKDWLCVGHVSQIMLDHPKTLGAFAERAYLDQIASLDQLLLTVKDSNQKNTWTELRATRVKEFVEKFPNSSQWFMVAKTYSQNEMEKGHEKAVMPILMKIMEKFPSEDAFYNVQYARFKMGDHDALMGDPKTKIYLVPGSKVSELYRETALILAQKAQAQDNLPVYREQINLFISLCTDPEKIKIARVDYFNFLIKGKKIENATQELFALSATELKKPEFSTLRQNLWKMSLEEGRFDLALKIANQSLGFDPTLLWRQRKILSGLCMGQSPSSDELGALPSNEQEYYLGLLVLTKSEKVIQHFKAKNRGLNRTEKNLVALAYQIHLNTTELSRNAEMESLLGGDYPFQVKPQTTPLLIEKNMEGVHFPDLNKLSAGRQSNVVKANIESVRYVRSIVPNVIKGKTTEIQVRVLGKAKDLEKKMGEYLVNSPIPKSLTGAQIEEYRKGIESAASEFLQQAKEFDSLINSLMDVKNKREQQLQSRILPAPDLKNWFPSYLTSLPSMEWVMKLLHDGNSSGALALLDYSRSANLKSDEDFFIMRSGVLLSGQPSSSLRRYVLEELEKNKQDKIIKSWAELVGRPVPEAK